MPQLSFYLPLAYSCNSYRCDVPFGMIEREGIGVDMPANSFVAAVDPDERFTTLLLTESKYGFRCDDNAVSLPLLHSGFEPEPYPENGIYHFRFAAGFFEGALSGDELIRRSQSYNLPVTVVSDHAHAGRLPLQQSYLTMESGRAILSGVKAPEDGSERELVVRLYEPNGEEDVCRLAFAHPVRAARMANLLETPAEQLEEISGNTLTVRMKPHQIVTLRVAF